MKNDKPIIALDFPTKQETEQFLELFGSETLNVKVGMELYYAQGRSFLSEIIAKGHHVFLDLKLHDIPITVERCIKTLLPLGVSMVNVHALGGYEMMLAAKRAVDSVLVEKRPLLIAVTQLTSTTQQQFQEEQHSHFTLEESAVHLAKLAKKAGCDGVVCSPHEVAMIKEACGQSFLTITPGIRQESKQVDDQARFMSVAQAKVVGCDYIVVGRPITQSDCPKKVYETILSDWK